MNKLMKLLPIVALMMGVTLAFAFAPVKSKLANSKKANTPSGWVDVTGQVVGVHYDCDEPLTPICTQEFDANNNPLPSTIERGTYSAIEP